MRLVLKASILAFFSFLQFNAQAQFSINSLFAPIDFRISLEIIESVSGKAVKNSNALSGTLSALSPIDYADSINGWQRWSIVENYAFGKDRGALPMITHLNALHPFFRDQVITLINKCKTKGIELAVVETYRTHAKQHEYKSMGKKYTNSAAGRSRHQYGLAIDVVPVVDSVAVWDNAALWRKIGVIGEKLGLRWGGRWRNPYDPGHFEWSAGLSTYHLGAGKLPKLPSFEETYPCLDEDIKMLKRFWKEWETSQSALTRK